MDEVIDAVLNHAKQGIIKVYNQYRYDKEKQMVLEAWEPSGNGMAVESAEGLKLSMPEGGNRACAGKVTFNGQGIDLRDVDITHCPAKSLEDTRFCPKTHPYGLFEGNVFVAELIKHHDRPPKSISATLRNSGRFTFA